MKNIKLFSMAALLIASATFVACSSDDNSIIENQQPANGKYTMTIQVSKGDDATTRALTLNDHTLNATWATTEHVYVQKGSEWATGSLQPQEAGTSTTLKGTLSGISIAANDELTLQFPKSGAISYAGQVGTLADIAANFDYATATVEVASVSATGNIIPKAATTTFTNLQAIVKFTLIDKADGTTPLSATQLVVNDGTNDYTINPTSGTSVIYVAIPGISGKTVTLTATVGDDTYTYEKSGVTFTNGQYYEITVKMTKQAPAPAGPVGAIFPFSVSATQQVYFSPGNLQYKSGEEYPWRFAEHQYDYLGVWFDDEWVDLFGWGTWTGSTPNPLQTSTTNSLYTWDNDDFTQENLLADASQRGYDWRTLTKDEWQYILNNSTYGMATITGGVHGGHGIIILPDESSLTINTDHDSWGDNTISASVWASNFEAYGAVFLPAAGIRGGTRDTDYEDYGHYWSSTPPSNPNSAETWYMYFPEDEEFEAVVDTDGRSNGCSVRLVRPAE